MNTRPLIWYIHGAHSSPTSFAYIKSFLPEFDGLDVVYSSSEPVAPVIDHLVEQIDKEDRPVYLIGHSLGGVMALAISQRASNVAGVVTLASPFGGCRVASLMRWMVPSRLFDDIHPFSTLISGLRRSPVAVPTLSVVTTAGGTPLLSEANDGVVTVESQQSLKGPVYVPVPVNHFEVLLSEDVCDLITGFIFNE